MKNQGNFIRTIKQYGKWIATISVLAGGLVLPRQTVAADPLSVVQFTCAGYSVLTVHVTDDGYPKGVARIICRMSVYNLQAQTPTSSFLHQPAPAFANTSEPRVAVDEAGFLPVLSW